MQFSRQVYPLYNEVHRLRKTIVFHTSHAYRFFLLDNCVNFYVPSKKSQICTMWEEFNNTFCVRACICHDVSRWSLSLSLSVWVCVCAFYFVCVFLFFFFFAHLLIQLVELRTSVEFEVNIKDFMATKARRLKSTLQKLNYFY